MTKQSKTLIETASQTAGPYVHIGCLPGFVGINGVYDEQLGKSPISEGAQGELVEIFGSIFDGSGDVLTDAMLESWQADAYGLYRGQVGADPCVSGFCRFATNGETGEFAFKTVKPGPVQDQSGTFMAPHINLWIVARGINIGLQTRLYFEDEDNEKDIVLEEVRPKSRRETLIAKRLENGRYRFDIHLQGDHETVFLDL